MNKSTILGAIFCVALFVLALPSIASPPDSPPAPLFVGDIKTVPELHVIAPVFVEHLIRFENHAAILADYKVSDVTPGEYMRRPDANVIAFRYTTGLRQMTTAPPR